MPNLVGASVNAGGTKIAAAKALGSSPLDTTKAINDTHTLVPHGNQMIPVKAAINMGLLQRNASGALVELNGPQAATRVNP